VTARLRQTATVSTLKSSVKTVLGRLGYTVQRLPPPRDDPQFALTVGFDFVVAHYLAARHDPRPFFFLQVGASDGIDDDPLRAYIRLHNWHGILIEPQAVAFERLTANYAGVDGLIFVKAAISERAGSRALHMILDEKGALLDSLNVTASFREEPLRAQLSKLSIPGASIGSVDVRCTTLAEVLADVTYLDLLQIDVEGFDLEVLKLFDFDDMKPPIVHFEHRHLSAPEIDEAFVFLAQHGYRMVREKYDTTAYLAPAPGLRKRNPRRVVERAR
jgi:FkbM family methyltransferase